MTGWTGGRALNLLGDLNRDQRLLFWSFLLWGLGAASFVYIQPLYIAQLGAAPEQIGLVLGLSGLLVTSLYIPLGLWADRRGRKPVMLLGWGISIVAAAGLALAPDWRWLIPALVLYYLSNIAMPAANGYIAASHAAQPGRAADVHRTFALLSSGASLGSLGAPALGGWIGEHLGLRMVYVFAAVLFTLSTLLLFWLTPQPVGPPAAAPGPARPAAPLWRHRPFLRQIAFCLLIFWALDLGQVMLPKFLRDTRGLSLGQIGWLGTLGTAGIIVFQQVLGRIRGERPWGLLAGQGLAQAALWLWLTAAGLPWIGLAYFIHGSDRVVRPLLMGRIARGLDAADLSLAYGFYETALRLGLAFSPLTAGWLYAQAPAAPLWASQAGLALTLLLTLALPGAARRPARAPESPRPERRASSD